MTDKYGALHTDGKTNNLMVIDETHHQIHEGNAFHMAAVDDTMGDGDTLIVTLTTPDTDKEIHITFWFDTLAGAHLEIITGITSHTGGVAITPKNLNLNSTNTTVTTETKSNPTLTGGTVLGSIYAFGSRRATAGASHSNELILEKNTKYAWKMTADGATNAIYLHLDWYEHTRLD